MAASMRRSNCQAMLLPCCVQHCRSHLLQQGPVLLACCSHRQGLLPQLQRLREGMLPPSRPRVLLGH